MHTRRAVSGTFIDTYGTVKTPQPAVKTPREKLSSDIMQAQLRLLHLLEGFKRQYNVEVDQNMTLGVLTLKVKMSLKPNYNKNSGGRGARMRRKVKRKQKQDEKSLDYDLKNDDQHEDSGIETREEMETDSDLKDDSGNEEIDTDSEVRRAGEVPKTLLPEYTGSVHSKLHRYSYSVQLQGTQGPGHPVLPDGEARQVHREDVRQAQLEVGEQRNAKLEENKSNHALQNVAKKEKANNHKLDEAIYKLKPALKVQTTEKEKSMVLKTTTKPKPAEKMINQATTFLENYTKQLMETKNYFFGSINDEQTVILLMDQGKIGNFIVRNHPGTGMYLLSWRSEDGIHDNPVIIKDKMFETIRNGKEYRYEDFKSLVKSLGRNKMFPLKNKEYHKNMSKSRYDELNQKKFFCFFCNEFHTQLHYCFKRNCFVNVDLNNLIMITANSLNGVIRKPGTSEGFTSINWYKNKFEMIINMSVGANREEEDRKEKMEKERRKMEEKK